MEEKKRDSTTAMGTKGTKIMIQGKNASVLFFPTRFTMQNENY